MSSLDLADFNEDNSELKIGVLVGVDYYHSFFTEKLIRNVHGPVASSSVFEWILSGRFPCSGDSASCLSIETHPMRCSLEQKHDENELLRKYLQKFWNVETIASPDENIIRKFENDIKHNGVRDVTKLRFKLDHDPDNYEICKNRLINLKQRLIKDKILNQYNEIFLDYKKQGIIEKVLLEEIPQPPGKVHYLAHRPVV